MSETFRTCAIPGSVILRSVFCALTTALTTPAAAEDLYGPPIWKGAYIGIHGAAAFTDVSLEGASSRSYDTGSVGGLVGFNIPLQFGVLGIEGDISRETIEDEFAVTFSAPAIGARTLDAEAKLTYSGTIRARFGVPAGAFLFYATAGYAWANLSLTADVAPFTSYTASRMLGGLVYGGGIEAKLAPNLSVRAEVLRFDYAKEPFDVDGVSSSIKSLDADETVVRGALTLHFY